MSLRKHQIYLDSNAGAPLQPSVVKGLRQLFFSSESGSIQTEHVYSRSKSIANLPSHIKGSEKAVYLLANPSSIHGDGRVARRLMAEARESIAESLGQGVDSEEITFTSSGSEANQFIIRSRLEEAFENHEHPEWIVTSVEHDSIKQMIEWFKSKKGVVIEIPVDSEGVIKWNKKDFILHFKPETSLVSLIWVNNETGVITPIERASSAIKKTNRSDIYLHIDAAQAWGKLPVQLCETQADAVSFSGHKIGAFGGCGLLWLKPGRQLNPLILGKQEKGRRGGTENVLGIWSMGVAAQALNIERSNEVVGYWRDRFEKALLDRIDGSMINGFTANRVKNTSNVSFQGLSGESLVMALDLSGFSVSSGSACSSGTLDSSHVLLAMGRNKDEAMASIRISLCSWILDHRDESEIWAEFESLLNSLEKTVKRMREVSVQNENREHYEYRFKE